MYLHNLNVGKNMIYTDGYMVSKVFQAQQGHLPAQPLRNLYTQQSLYFPSLYLILSMDRQNAWKILNYDMILL